jgi:hypothetical protein
VPLANRAIKGNSHVVLMPSSIGYHVICLFQPVPTAVFPSRSTKNSSGLI